MIAALIAVFAAGMAAAEAPLSAPSARVAAAWKIGGVGLGMSPAEVEGAMKAAGYRRDYRYMGRSWQGEVANQVSILRGVRITAGDQVISKEDYRLGQERIHVTYLAGPGGPYVSRVDYAISADAIDAERFKAAALAKYGKPTLRWDFESLYCSVGERECSRTGSLVTNQLPNLTVYVAYVTSRKLHLDHGERAEKAYYAAVRAEAERLYPKKDKPTF